MANKCYETILSSNGIFKLITWHLYIEMVAYTVFSYEVPAYEANYWLGFQCPSDHAVSMANNGKKISNDLLKYIDG